MTYCWSRIIPLFSQESRLEKWLYFNKQTQQRKIYPVAVKLGKELDITSLKAKELSGFQKEVLKVKNSREKLFQGELKQVPFCPICQEPLKENKPVFMTYGAAYGRCPACGHCYLLQIPNERAISNFYSQDKHFQETYTDRKTTLLRLKEVALPKAEWTIAQFRRLYKRNPRSILDVGAGAGHFVWTAQKLGLRSQGIELSKPAKQFAQNVLGLGLLSADFVKDWQKFKDCEVITFWGLLEHLPSPLRMLKAAHKILQGRKGLLVSSVPRWDSFSTAVQQNFPASIIRHLDPLGHLHCFSDNSLSTAYFLSNFAPTGAWYFGMDAYELFSQLSFYTSESQISQENKTLIAGLQKTIDRALLSDEIALAGRPF